MTLEERARAYLVKHDCPPGHRAIAAVMEAMADERERCARVADKARGAETLEGMMPSTIAAAIRNLGADQ